jgi:hydrogenase expression/formation protein HypE
MNEKITLAHGAGGEKMDLFIKKTILKHFTREKNIEIPLSMLDDSAVIDDIVFSTDSHTVQPLFFPGGDIGSLSVAGTINDISVMGAKPLALSSGLIIEEGLSFTTIDNIVLSMSKSVKKAKVPIITGDTKVVEHGAIQECMINTSGIGKRTSVLDKNFETVNQYRKCSQRWLLDSNLKPGDKILISGTIGDHGIALMSFREGYGFETTVKSDIQPLNDFINSLLNIGGIVAAKDPTRGGLANTVNEFSEKSGYGIRLEEEHIPISKGVDAACDLLGFDPLHIGNEGKVVIGVVKEKAQEILEQMRKLPEGKKAAIIGEVTKKKGYVVMRTNIGGKRIISKPIGDPIPRIC